VLTDIFIALT